MHAPRNDAQRLVLEAGLLDGPFSAVLQLPTGAGKTWLALQAVRRALARGRHAVVVSPLRALIGELADRWGPVLGSGLVVAAGEGIRVDLREARCLLTTPERLDLLTRRWRRNHAWMADVGRIVVDEAHLLGEPVRGPRLEGALIRLRGLAPLAPVLALSATLGDPHALAAWLGGVVVTATERPVPLRWRVLRFGSLDDKPATLLRAVRDQDGASLVFVHSRRRAEELAARLGEGGVDAEAHHAGLGGEARAAVEGRLRDGALRAVVATGTLELGMNLPCRQVVLYDTHQWTGSRFEPFSAVRAWQRAGRAGRPDLDPHGVATVLLPSWDRVPEGWIEGRFEPIRSGFAAPAAASGLVVAEVAAGLSLRRPHVRRALGRTLASGAGEGPDPDAVIDACLAAGMVTEHDGRLRATKLGHVAARHLLEPDQVARIRDGLRCMQQPTPLDLTLLAWTVSGGSAPVDRELLPALATATSALPSALLQGSHEEVIAALGVPAREVLAALRVAVALLERHEGDEAVARRWGAWPAELARWGREVHRVLRAVGAVGGARARPVLDRTLARVVHALPLEAAELAVVPGIGPVTAARLVSRGVRTLADLERWAGALGTARGSGWALAAAALQEVPGPTAAPARVVAGEAAGIDPYRLRRALDLRVRSGEDGLVVDGGLEPHRVVDGRCDCADAARGNRCKHLIAVALMLGELDAAPLAGASAGRGLDLDRCWRSRG